MTPTDSPNQPSDPRRVTPLVVRAELTPQERDRVDELLLAAVGAGEPRSVRNALTQGASVNARDERRRTPLVLAATHDRLDVARLLLANGAEVDALDDQHDTAWLITGVTGSVDMGRLLLSAGADLTIRNRFGGLSPIPASERGHVDYVRWVVGTPVDLDHRNDLGWTALLEAIVLGDGSRPYQQIVTVLLRAGADPSISDHQGRDARTLAAEQGFRDLVRIIDQHQ